MTAEHNTANMAGTMKDGLIAVIGNEVRKGGVEACIGGPFRILVLSSSALTPTAEYILRKSIA